MLDISNVYNYYSSTLTKPSSKLDSHKNSELKSIYSNMIKHNKNTPLYKFNLNNINQDYAIGIKDAAIELNNLSKFIGDDVDGVFSEKTLASSDESKVYASINNGDFNKVPSPLSINVQSLAAHQINIGSNIRTDYQSMSAKEHQFNIVTSNRTYEFSVSVDKGEHNYPIQKRLVSAINNADIPIKASLDVRDLNAAVVLESTLQGSPNTSNGLAFWIEDKSSGNSIVSVLGLNNVFQEPSDSVFTINGDLHTSASNNISINNTVSIDLLAPTSEDVSISIVPDNTKVMDSVSNFVNAYNRLHDLASSPSNNPNGTRRLMNDLKNVFNRYDSYINSVGLILEEDGRLASDTQVITKSIKDGSFQTAFNDASDFKKAISNVTEKIALDPISYVDKVTISYPNISKSFPSPYVPSRYSGLLYNQYL